MNRCLVAVLPFVFAWSAAALAEEPEPPVEYQERTIIDYVDGVRVEGKLYKPQVSLLTDRRREGFHPLIRLRDNFTEESRRSVDAVK